MVVALVPDLGIVSILCVHIQRILLQVRPRTPILHHHHSEARETRPLTPPFISQSMYPNSNKLEISKVSSGMLYFGYMFVVSCGFFLLTGTIRFYSCFLFTRKIYGSVKID